MSTGQIKFELGVNGHVTMLLTTDGRLVLESSSVESVVHEVERRSLAVLRLDDEFEFSLPASSATLDAAAQVNFKFPLAAYKLVAACAWLT